MGSLWVPPKVDRKLKEESNAYTASVESMVDRFRGILSEYTARLKEIDPHLELIFARPNAAAAGLVPGRYHVMRHNPGAPPSLMVVEGPNGEFIEPGSRLLDEVRAKDMWSPEAVRDRERARARREYEREMERQRETELRQQELLERWRAATQTSISMHRTVTPWTQNRSGNSRRYAGERRKAG